MSVQKPAPAFQAITWDLYWASQPFECAAANETLNVAVEQALEALDARFAEDGVSGKAVEEAFASVLAVMDTEPLANAGAGDTEPRSQLASILTRHLRERHQLEGAAVDRWGGVHIGPERRFGR